MPNTGSGTGTPITCAIPGTTGDGIGLEPTLLAPARYAQIMHIPAPHFFQLAGPKAPLRGGCDDIWDHDAREALVWAIQQAEQLIAIELQFWPAPKWFVNEEHLFEDVRSDWWNAEYSTKWKYVQAFGTQQLNLLQEGAFVSYSDDDGDPYGREELATVGSPGVYSYLPPCPGACDVRVFFRTEDGAWDDHDDRFLIRNLRTDIDGGLMYLKGESSMFVKPALWLLTEADAPDGSWVYPFDTDNLVGLVDVYCEAINQANPVTLYWESGSACGGTACGYTGQCACAFPTDLGRGFFAVRPATWNGTSNVSASPYCGTPIKFTVSYLAGYPLDPRTCRMDAKLERAIVKLTNVLLPEPPCGYCDAAKVLWERDRKPIDPLTPEAASMPWDMYSQGALEAWRIVKMLAYGRGGKL